jgi:SpoVK/Ycf46/Vps4 family AAA+-type ATPase
VHETERLTLRDDRSTTAQQGLTAETILAPGGEGLQPLDLYAIQSALKLIVELGHKFNLRRDINDVMSLAAPALVWPLGVAIRLQKFMVARCVEHPAWQGSVNLSPAEFMARFAHFNGTGDDATLYYYIDEFAKQNTKDLFAVFRASIDAIGERIAGKRLLLADNVALLARVLGLSDAEQKLLLLASLCKYKRELRPILVDCKVANSREAYLTFAMLMGLSVESVTSALKPGARLERLSLVETPIAEQNVTDLADLLRVSDRLLPILMTEYASETQMMAMFARPAEPAALGLSDFPHLADDARYLAALIGAACKTQTELGINVLIYGPPGTGKTQFARAIAATAACELYEVECIDKDGSSLSGRDRYRSLQVSQAFLKGRAGTAILFDEVEDVFPPAGRELTNLFGQDDARAPSVGGKAWVNQTLEQNPVPTLWISNAIGQIDPAYLRRFQFHVEMKAPPPEVREAITRRYLEPLGVTGEFAARIAARKTLTPAQVQSAARFAALTRESLAEDAEGLILRQLDQADKALGQFTIDEVRTTITTYDLDYLNTESRFELSRIVNALQARRRGTLCFYGPPGTGKTALGEHIAKALGRPLMIRRASDLLSKFVGETEQQMAGMFAQAKDEKAVLLLDEADSFLQNRQLAQRNWEVTEVNEMLQQMERFEGVFICTTNLFDRIDEAALRRFNFKIRFKPLTARQSERMFTVEALGGDSSALMDLHRRALGALPMLTPGDFATVKRQALLLDEVLTPEEWLAMLAEEHAIKPDVKYERKIGFA